MIAMYASRQDDALALMQKVRPIRNLGLVHAGHIQGKKKKRGDPCSNPRLDALMS